MVAEIVARAYCVRVKTRNALVVCYITGACACMLLIVGCASLSHEFLGTPAAGTVITNAAAQTQLPPPFTAQMQAASGIVAQTVPTPEGTLVATLLTLLGAGAAAIATFHAGKAASSSASAVTAATTATAAKPMVSVQPVSSAGTSKTS